MQFDLRTYLNNNPLLTEEKLSSDEQNIVDDILSVNEGFNDIMDKIKSYAKKGLLTTAILMSVVGSLKAQNQPELANQVEKAATELTITPAKKSGEEVVWQKKSLGMSIVHKDGMYKLGGNEYTYHGTNIINPSTGRGMGYHTSSSAGGEWLSKEDMINALKTGIELTRMERPEPGEVNKAEGDGILLTVDYVHPNWFKFNGVQFSRAFANQSIRALQSFAP